MTRRWSLMATVLIVGIVAASWFLLVSPKRGQASELRGQATQQQASNAALVQKLNELKAQSLDLPKQKAQLATFRKEIPDNPALPSLIRDLTSAGRKVGVDVVSMKPGTPVAVVAPVTAPVPVAATDPAATDTAATDGTTAATPAPVVVAAAPSLYMVPLALDITGSYFEVEQFINKLEGMQRKFLLSGFTLTPLTGAAATSGAGGMTLTLNGQVFLAPNVAAATSTPVAAPAAAQAQ